VAQGPTIGSMVESEVMITPQTVGNDPAPTWRQDGLDRSRWLVRVV